MTPWDHLLAFTLAVLFPLRSSVVSVRRLTRAEPEDVPRLRLWLYRHAIALQWTLALAVLALWALATRPLSAIGLVPTASGGALGVLAGLLVAGALVWRQRQRALADDEALAEVRARLAHIERLMPHDDREMRRFYALSITAGLCEELLYRGYLTWYLAQYAPPWAAMAGASVLFGLGHVYQGWRGVAVTALLGGFFAAVVWVAGSLYPAMLIHTLMDVHSGHLAYAAYRREEETATAFEGPEAAADAAERPTDAPA